MVSVRANKMPLRPGLRQSAHTTPGAVQVFLGGSEGELVVGSHSPGFRSRLHPSPASYLTSPCLSFHTAKNRKDVLALLGLGEGEMERPGDWREGEVLLFKGHFVVCSASTCFCGISMVFP